MSGVVTTSNIDITGSDIHIISVVFGNTGTYICAAVSSAFNISITRTFQLFVGGMYPRSPVLAYVSFSMQALDQRACNTHCVLC